MLREALALGNGARRDSAPGGGFAGVTRADLPAAPTGALRADGRDPARFGPRPVSSRRRWVTAGVTAVLCAFAAATGLYLSGHIHGQTSGDAGNNTVQHISSSAGTPSQSTSQPVTTSPTPSTVEQPSTVPGTTASPKPTKTSKPTSSPKASSSRSASSSASSSTSASASSSSSSSASSSPSSPPPSTP